MTVFNQPFMFFDSPRGGTDQLDKAKAAGFQGGFGNVIDYAPTEWDVHRARAKEQGMFFGAWGRTGHPPPQGTGFEPQKLERIINTAAAWGHTPLVANCEKEIDNSGSTLTKHIALVLSGFDAALSTEAWPFGNVDWTPVAHLPVLPQIFPQDWWGNSIRTRDAVMKRAHESKAEWHKRGVKCVWFTFGTYGNQTPDDYTLKAPFSLYTADAIGVQNYGLWKPTSSGFVGCVEPTPPPPPPKKTVKQYRSDIEALAKEAVALHSLGPHSRLRIIEREAGTEFPDDQWRVELGPEINLLLDQARGDE